MNIAVRYYTRTGNTEKLAKAIAEAVSASAEKVDVALQEKADILFLGCSYYAFDVDDAVKQFISENRSKIGKIYCFGTSAMLGSTKKQVKKASADIGVSVADEEFHCYGSFGPMHKGRPNEKDIGKAVDFAKKVKESAAKQMENLPKIR